jgi:hypothetical protein
MEITQLNVFNKKKKSGRFGEKSGKTELKKLKVLFCMNSRP